MSGDLLAKWLRVGSPGPGPLQGPMAQTFTAAPQAQTWGQAHTCRCSVFSIWEEKYRLSGRWNWGAAAKHS